MTPTSTYTGLPSDYTPSSQALANHIPHPQPAPLPSLQSIIAGVTMDKTAHLPSTWRQGIGKQLSNEKIFEYQLLGKYGPDAQKIAQQVLRNREGDKRPCCVVGCKHKLKRRYANYGYLPQPGVYCQAHIKEYRDKRDKEREERTREKEIFEAEYQ